MEDRADDVIDVFVYSGKEGDFIICKEAIFQATSKKSGGGFTSISGYNEYRLSVYDLKTGALKARQEIGEGIEEEKLVLGCYDGLIWMFGAQKELGLHARSIVTLEIVKTQAQLMTSGPLKNFQFAYPEWSRLEEYYMLDAFAGVIHLTDRVGRKYVYNFSNQQLNESKEKWRSWRWDDQRKTDVYQDNDRYFRLKGDARKFVEDSRSERKSDKDYLNGQLLKDNDAFRTSALMDKERKILNSNIRSIEDTMLKLEQLYPFLKEGNYPYGNASSAARVAYNDYRTFGWQKEEMVRQLDRFNESSFDFNNRMLAPDTNHLIVLHANEISDTAGLMCSYLSIEPTGLRELWSLRIPGMYYDPGKADQKGAFETVFSDGNPEFRFERFTYHGTTLVMIYQLTLTAIDVQSGKVLWQKPI
jgi:hypothetical protein